MTRRKLPLYAEKMVATLQMEMVARSQAFRETIPRVSCKKGCSACCSHPVYITIVEGLLLYQWLTDHGRWTPSLRQRVTDHSVQTWDLAFPIWLTAAIPCPLLEGTACTAYAARPFPCRTMFSSGDPQFCHPHALGENTRIVARNEVVQDFITLAERMLKQHKVNFALMSISRALLFADRLLTGSMDIEQVNVLMIQAVLAPK